MIDMSNFIVMLIFVASSLLLGRRFYTIQLKNETERLARDLKLPIQQLSYSLEQISYFVSLPSSIPTIKNAKPEDVIIKLDYKSTLFPRLSGIKIMIFEDSIPIVLAYLSVQNFRIPELDHWLRQGKINESDYLKISAMKIMDPDTLKEIAAEVYKQIQLGRRRRTVS